MRTSHTLASWMAGAATAAGCLLLLPVLGAWAQDDPNNSDVVVLAKDAVLPSAKVTEHHMRRIVPFLEALPEGHKARISFVTRAPGGEAIRYIQCITPLDPKGRPDGVELHYADWYRAPVRTVDYRAGLQHGVEKTYGTTRSQDMETGKLVWRQYLRVEIPFADGKAHGLKRTFHENGEVATATPYADGNVEGESRSFSPEGRVIRIANFSGGKRQGEVVDNWPENGSRKRIVTYRDGLVHGMSRAYYADGSLKWERPFKDNELHGIERHFAPDGGEEKTRYWVAGEPVEKSAFEEQFKE